MLFLEDHLGGFNKNLKNLQLDSIQELSTIQTEYIFDNKVQINYPHINFVFNKQAKKQVLNKLTSYNIHPEINYTNFACSFNGSNHVGRQLLSSILNNQRYFNTDYCSKNFAHSNNFIIGHLSNLDLSESEILLYSKFFINNNDFNNSVYSFGHVQYAHDKNIYNLEHKLTQSFIHIVSETLSTSYYPFVTEKFLYSVVTRGLFLAYAQPGWHKHIEKYYGFGLYNKIFDYEFDNIQNPVKRLIRLIEMISKFSKLSTDDWRDLYLLEQNTIEYNYEHYFSGDYLKHLAQFE